MTFKMNKREHEIMTLAFKIREITADCDPDAIDAAIAICVALNDAEREKKTPELQITEISHIIAEGLARGMHDAISKIGSPFESMMPPQEKDEPKQASGPVGPLTPEEIAKLNEEEPDAK
jgi:hypothetical protein